MRCTHCEFENQEIAKFCEQCGTRLARSCPSCGQDVGPQAKFCLECGQNLTAQQESKPSPADLTPNDQVAKIQRYLPKGLAEKILSQRNRIEGERKQVTVMFCDLEGFTTLTEKLDPEDAYALMDQIYEILIHKVHDYEGTVNEMTGDGIMALFGAPVALEDAPQRAIRSALAIHREMVRFNDKAKKEQPGLPTLKMRIGIHTGPVVVGTLGNDLRVEFKAVGDTVNLASRMEGLAEPGATYVTGETFGLTEGLFRFEGLGEKEVKGKEEPVSVYRVIAPSTRRTRFDVSAERGLTSFVARQRELELLLDAFERAKGERGQAVSVVADAGVGKSRLLYEFRKAIANEDVTFLEGKCLSYSRGVAYHPVVDILKGNFDIRDGDGEAVIVDKVQRGLKILRVDDGATKPYLLELLSIKDSGIDHTLSPEARKDRTIQALSRIVLRGAESRPLILSVEDLHWMDKSSEDVFKDFLEHITGARVLLLFTYRPEYVQPWGGRSYHSQVNLNRLSNRETLAMVTHILGTDEVHQDLENLIFEKTEGVPFFIEEFLKSLRDLRILERQDHSYVLAKDIREVVVPSTIQDVLMARADALPEGAKEVLQTASAIEREFNHALLQTVTGLTEPELLSHLSVLKDAELLYERGVHPDSTYIFKHALTREVVYASILARRRRELHRRIGTAIEALHSDHLVEHYEILSDHFFQGEDFVRAARYLERAARKAEKSASLGDAIAHARRRVLCVEKALEPGAPGTELIDARTVLGLYLNQINHWAEARDAVAPVVRLARETGYRKRLCQIQTVMGSYYAFLDENFPNAFEALDEALRIAAEEGDVITLILASQWQGIFQAWDCDFDKAIKSIQKAVDVNVAAKSVWGIGTQKAQLAYFCYFNLGRINSLAGLSLEALKLAEESGDPISRGISHTAYGYACYCKGHLEEAENHALEGRNLLVRVGVTGWAGLASTCLAETYFQMKKYDKSRKCWGQLSQAYVISQSWTRLAQLGMARCGAILGERDVSLESLRENHAQNRMKAAEGWMCRYLGEIRLNLGGRHMAEAEQWMRKAIEADTANRTRFHLGLDHALYGEFSKRQGDRAKAQEELGKAVEILRECGADGWVKRTEEKLAQL
jgi:class 3 adenylate cyclase/tetratricopeptide (TPR) repeat protein